MFTLPATVLEFMNTIRESGFEVYVVGGAVRNLILNKPVTNWDFTTNATPEKIQKLFPDSFYHNTYGTVTIKNGNDLFEITPFRKESNYTDNRHPEKIEWAKTVGEDLARRDFTINAMAFDGKKIIDIFEGKKHIDERKIVAVGNADTRFQEDALRMMRGIRFASQLGFLIDDETRNAMTRNSKLIKNISWERIRDELLKIVGSDHSAEGVLFLKSTGILKHILPELNDCFAIPQKSPNRHHIYDVGTHLVMSLKSCPSSDPVTRLASLLHDIGKVGTFHKDQKTQMITFYNHEVIGTIQAKQIADRLRLSNEQKTKFVRLIEFHQFTVTEDQTDKAVRRFIKDVGKEYIQDMLDLRTADRVGSGATPTSWRLDLFKKRIVEVQKEPFTVKDLKVDGTDVMKVLNIKPSKQVGDILDKLFEQVVEKKLENDREILLKNIHA
ncbi:polynucleotide adenylyltransferase [Candidatus Roizmanbacteria bacterium CG03_land_8_20_14_0_80_39_12]|uniref:Polynucleotide adenylyltransferase n=2 Tax=Candidatus Roizmaniibacteriota TaxID=1752723 RepID=A0A2M7BRE7_9BACT|nr:MAG: polynucleotide adenylyltransferase [Candidatus Roizmanbacteria bacterium CG03_land_8_20_14_0_80_39_12]